MSSDNRGHGTVTAQSRRQTTVATAQSRRQTEVWPQHSHVVRQPWPQHSHVVRQPWPRHSHVVRQPWPRHSHIVRQPWPQHSHVVRQPWPRHSHVVRPKYGHIMATVRHDRSIACALMQCRVRSHALTLESQRMTDVFGWDGKEHTLPQMRQPAPCLQAAARHRWLRGGQRYRRTTLVAVALWAVMPLPNAQANLTPTDDTSVDTPVCRSTRHTACSTIFEFKESRAFSRLSCYEQDKPTDASLALINLELLTAQ
jgi:hypothetical protein